MKNFIKIGSGIENESMLEDLIYRLKKRQEEINLIPYNKELFEKNYKDVSSDDKGLKTFELLGEKEAIIYFLNKKEKFDNVSELKDEIERYIEELQNDSDSEKVFNISIINHLKSFVLEFKE